MKHPVIEMGKKVKFRWDNGVSTGLVRGVMWNREERMYIVYVQRIEKAAK
jgi:hypothetical protein